MDITALTEVFSSDLGIARDWKPGTLKDDGKRGSAPHSLHNVKQRDKPAPRLHFSSSDLWVRGEFNDSKNRFCASVESATVAA